MFAVSFFLLTAIPTVTPFHVGSLVPRFDMTLLWKRRMWPLYNKGTYNDVISIRQTAERNPPDLALDSRVESVTVHGCQLAPLF